MRILGETNIPEQMTEKDNTAPRKSITETFEALRNSPLGEALNKVDCVCKLLWKDEPCDLNCSTFVPADEIDLRHPTTTTTD